MINISSGQRTAHSSAAGKTKIVLCIAKPDKAKEALDAGADFAGGEEYVNKIKDENWFGFDAIVATPDMMGQVGKIGRVLGPRGLMPNPKSGTVTPNVAKAVAEFKGGKIEYRNDRYGLVHVPIGKGSFDAPTLLENLNAMINEIVRARPASAKGIYVRSLSISSTMGPGIKIDISDLQ